MKQADVKIGGEYLTRVGDSLVRVRVTGTREESAVFSRRPRTRTLFVVERVDPAPKRAHRKLTPRSAARLRPARARRTA